MPDTAPPTPEQQFAGASLNHHTAAVQALVAANDQPGAWALLQTLEAPTLRLMAIVMAQGAVLTAVALSGEDRAQVAAGARAAAAEYQQLAVELAAQLEPPTSPSD